MTTKSGIEQLFRTHYAEMYQLSMRILHNDEISKDIIHDIFESILTAHSDAVSGAYLLQAVRNRCINYLRGLSVSERIKELYALDEQEIANEEWPDEDTISNLNAAIDEHLTPACRRVVKMRYLDNKSYSAIAEAFSISEVAVYKHLRKAIEVLRKKLTENG